MIQRRPRWWRASRVLASGSAAAWLLLAACVRVAVESATPEPSPTRGGAATAWVFAWGLARTPKITADCDPGHVHRTTVQTTVPGALLGLVTLGIVLPVRVEYTCAAAEGVVEGEPPR